jgi:ubiquinone/menaquinone biosynthesis C-methylase UbiE
MSGGEQGFEGESAWLTRLAAQLSGAAPRTGRLGFASPAEVRRVQAVLAEVTHELTARARSTVEPASTGPVPIPLDTYRQGIDRFNAAQHNSPLLDGIRAYNHTVIESLHQSAPLDGKVVLDIGASPHGYALERALALGASRYIGIGLDVAETVLVSGPAGVGELRYADAEALPFAEASIDVIVSMSTFEHVAHVDRCLLEMSRVLRPGGVALATFEPIWTCSYGHHLHHFGPVSSLVPDWAHLIWTREEMRTYLSPIWPPEAEPTLDEAVSWVYDSPAINRIGIREMKALFEAGPLEIAWMLPLEDRQRDDARLSDVSRATGLTREELLTKGWSVLLRAAPAGLRPDRMAT